MIHWQEKLSCCLSSWVGGEGGKWVRRRKESSKRRRRWGNAISTGAAAAVKHNGEEREKEIEEQGQEISDTGCPLYSVNKEKGVTKRREEGVADEMEVCVGEKKKNKAKPFRHLSIFSSHPISSLILWVLSFSSSILPYLLTLLLLLCSFQSCLLILVLFPRCQWHLLSLSLSSTTTVSGKKDLCVVASHLLFLLLLLLLSLLP